MFTRDDLKKLQVEFENGTNNLTPSQLIDKLMDNDVDCAVQEEIENFEIERGDSLQESLILYMSESNLGFDDNLDIIEKLSSVDDPDIYYYLALSDKYEPIENNEVINILDNLIKD